jgi:hypothetical protein
MMDDSNDILWVLRHPQAALEGATHSAIDYCLLTIGYLPSPQKPPIGFYKKTGTYSDFKMFKRN